MEMAPPPWAMFLGCCYQRSSLPNSSHSRNNILGWLCLSYVFIVFSIFHHLESIQKKNFPSTLISFSVCRVVILRFTDHEHTSAGHTAILNSLIFRGFLMPRSSPWHEKNFLYELKIWLYFFIFPSLSVSHLARWLIGSVFLYLTFVFCPHWHCFTKASILWTVFAH